MTTATQTPPPSRSTGTTRTAPPRGAARRRPGTRRQANRVQAVRPAGFWIRAAALIIDLNVLFLIGVLAYLTLAIFGLAWVTHGGPRVGSGQSIVGIIVVVLIIGAYLLVPVWLKAFFEYRYGGTPGKLACLIRVRTRDKRKRGTMPFHLRNHPLWVWMGLTYASIINLFFNASSMQDAQRNVAIFGGVTLLGFLYWLTSCIVAAFKDDRTALHDLAGGTVCVRVHPTGRPR